MHQLWLLFLGLATGLVIKLRRVLRRQSPLDDELHSKQVAIAHVQSGVAWVRGDLTFGSVNQSFADTFKMLPRDFIGLEWYKIFSPGDHALVRESYGQMMLRGMTSFEAAGERSNGSLAWLDVRLVPVHDGQMRFVGHHCMIGDKSRERELELQVQDLEERLENLLEQNSAHARTLPAPNQPAIQSVQSVNGSRAASPPILSSNESLDALRRATGRSLVTALDSLRKSPKLGPVLPLTEKR
jgi:PAS domain-containing protein